MPIGSRASSAEATSAPTHGARRISPYATHAPQASSRARTNTASIIVRRQLARERVLLARVKAAEQRPRVAVGDHGVAELRLRPRHRRAAQRGAQPQRALPREAAQAHDHVDVRQQRDLALQPLGAVRALRRRRQVRRRRAPHRGDDVRAVQPQPVVARDRLGLVGQPDPMQRREQEVARAVAGEDPAGPVAAVRGRREPEDQHARGGIAEPLHRPAPVVPVAERRPLLARHLLAPLDQPRAAAAVDDRLIERLKGGHGRFDASSGYALNRMRRTALIAAAARAAPDGLRGGADVRFRDRVQGRSGRGRGGRRPARGGRQGRRRGEDLRRHPLQAARHRAQERRRGLRDRDGPRDRRRQRLRPHGPQRQGQRPDRHRAGPPGRQPAPTPPSRSSRKAASGAPRRSAGGS